jgi:hypothetical protein
LDKEHNDADLISDGGQGSETESKNLSPDNFEEAEPAESCLKERVVFSPEVSYGEEAL